MNAPRVRSLPKLSLYVTGALGLPDIGQLFPDNDPKWKGCTSDVFIAEACRLMRENGEGTASPPPLPPPPRSRAV